MDSYLHTLGQRIREARQQLDMSQERLAHESGLDRSYVGRVERGEQNLSFMTLVKIAKALGQDVAALTIDLPTVSKSSS